MTPEIADALRNILLEELELEDALLLKIAEAIPEDQMTWKPEAAKAWGANELAHHCAAAAHFFLSVFDGTAGAPSAQLPAPTEKIALLESIRTTQAHFRNRVAQATPEQLAAPCDFFGTETTGIAMLNWHKMHMVHHRGQVALYLRLMGAQVPGTYGPSGDEG